MRLPACDRDVDHIFRCISKSLDQSVEDKLSSVG